MSDNVDFRTCPVGIENKAEIKNTNDRIGLMMQRLEDKIDIVKLNVSSIDDRMGKLENKIDDLQAKLPEIIDNEIKEHNNENAMRVIKWVITALCSSVVITVVTKMVVSAMSI